jgi:CcmD family protein
MNANYVVMIVVLIIWIGIFLYLMGLDRKVKKLEDRNEA